MFDGGGNNITHIVVLQQDQVGLDVFGVEWLAKFKPLRFQGAIIVDTQQPWQPGILCDDDMGLVASTELGSA